MLPGNVAVVAHLSVAEDVPHEKSFSYQDVKNGSYDIHYSH